MLHGSRPIPCEVIVPSVPPNESDAEGPAAGGRLFVDLLEFSNETAPAAKGFPNGEVFSGNGGDHIDVSFLPKDIWEIVLWGEVAEER